MDQGAYERRSCAFCGGRPVTAEHVFPRWIVPLVSAVRQARSATLVTTHDEHHHHIWNVNSIDMKARKVCRACNSGWMSSLEVSARPILTPLISSLAPVSFSKWEAAVLARWVGKMALTASLLHPDDTNPVDQKYFREMSGGKAPLRDAVVWIAPYEVGTYPVSSSMIEANDGGFRVTGNVGCLAYQVTVADGVGEQTTLVVPPDRLFRSITQLWPTPRMEVAMVMASAWPGIAHLGRRGPPLDDDDLRYWSHVDDHAWGVED